MGGSVKIAVGPAKYVTVLTEKETDARILASSGDGGGLTLGNLSTNAYYGDKGKTAYDHSQTAHAPSNAEQNVNADWNSVSGDSQILNKPTILGLGDLSTNAYYGDKGKTAYDHSQTAHAPSNAEQNVNADWNSVSGDSQILNKPTILGLGDLSTNAYYGDKGKTAYDHSQTAHAPSNAEQNVNADWNSVSGDSQILNKPTISTPAWKGVIVGCAGNGDPNLILNQACSGTIIPMTPTLLTISLARISYFKLDTSITFNKVRFFGIGATTNIYQLAIYNADTLARIWTSGTFSTASQTWGSIGSAINITLSENQLYFIAVSANTTGTTAGMLCFGATTTRVGVLPKNWPGSLDVDSNYVFPPNAQGQFAVTTGALPNPAATIAALGSMACGFPVVFLDSNNG